jgi:hypothetical protein
VTSPVPRQKTHSYRDPPAGQITMPAGSMSIPLGPHLAIFEQVRAAPAPSERRLPARALLGSGPPASALGHTSARGKGRGPPQAPALPAAAPAAVSTTPARGGMTRGAGARGRGAQLDQLQWMRSVRPRARDGSASASASGDSAPGSRIGSRSRGVSAATSVSDRERERERARSDSAQRAGDVRSPDSEVLSWQDEYATS